MTTLHDDIHSQIESDRPIKKRYCYQKSPFMEGELHLAQTTGCQPAYLSTTSAYARKSEECTRSAATWQYSACKMPVSQGPNYYPRVSRANLVQKVPEYARHRENIHHSQRFPDSQEAHLSNRSSRREMPNMEAPHQSAFSSSAFDRQSAQSTEMLHALQKMPLNLDPQVIMQALYGRPVDTKPVTREADANPLLNTPSAHAANSPVSNQEDAHFDSKKRKYQVCATNPAVATESNPWHAMQSRRTVHPPRDGTITNKNVASNAAPTSCKYKNCGQISYGHHEGYCQDHYTFLKMCQKYLTMHIRMQESAAAQEAYKRAASMVVPSGSQSQQTTQPSHRVDHLSNAIPPSKVQPFVNHESRQMTHHSRRNLPTSTDEQARTLYQTQQTWKEEPNLDLNLSLD